MRGDRVNVPQGNLTVLGTPAATGAPCAVCCAPPNRAPSRVRVAKPLRILDPSAFISLLLSCAKPCTAALSVHHPALQHLPLYPLSNLNWATQSPIFPLVMRLLQTCP